MKCQLLYHLILSVFFDYLLQLPNETCLLAARRGAASTCLISLIGRAVTLVFAEAYAILNYNSVIDLALSSPLQSTTNQQRVIAICNQWKWKEKSQSRLHFHYRNAHRLFLIHFSTLTFTTTVHRHCLWLSYCSCICYQDCLCWNCYFNDHSC